MPHDPVEALRNEIAKGRVLAIVGAGISIGATKNAPTASWTGLLEDGVKRCVAVAQPLPDGWADRIRAEIHSGDMDDLLSAAEKISRKLGFPNGGNYRAWLRDAVGTLRSEDRSVLEALRDLGVLLATTNYDGLLEEVTNLPPVTWRDGAKVERVIRGDEEGILHLHGHWSQPESVILGIRSYEEILRDIHAQNILRTLCTIKTLLFVGCGDGLSDPNFGALLQWIRTVFAGSEYPNYRLCRDLEAPALRDRHPREERIVLLPYGATHSDLAPFLSSLLIKSRATKEEKPLPERRPPSLPPPPHCFGRADQVADLVFKFCADPPLPVLILGPPGVGKTTITVTALHDRRVIEKYGARRYFVRCDGAKSRDALIGEITAVLQLEPGPNPENRLFLDLERAPAVLALDNAEVPWEADAVAVETLFTQLTAVPGLALVASLRGEQRPLGPNWREATRVGPLDLESARTAFLALAGERHRNDLNLDPLLEAVARLPLAITLLAYQAEGEPDLYRLSKLWQKERRALLQRGDGRERLTNLEASLELSIQGSHMTEPAHRLLALLGILPDGTARQDLDALMPRDGEIAASILRRVGLAVANGSRLRVLAPVREHVSRLHPPQPEDSERVIAHYLNLAELGERAGAQGGAEAIERLTPETGNLEAMILRGLERSAPTPAIVAALALAELYRFTGSGTTAILERARESARRAHDEKMEARCTKRLGDMALHRSNYDTAREWYQKALSLFKDLDDLEGQASCIRKLGLIAFDYSDYDTALKQFQEALSLYEHLDHRHGQAKCILSLGDLALRSSNYDTAFKRYHEALPLFQQVEDLLGQASCVLRFGYIALDKLDYEAALERFYEALSLFQRVGDLLGQANCIRNLGEIAFRRLDYDIAHKQFQDALALYERVGSLHGQTDCIQSLGDVDCDRRDRDTARSWYQKALTLSKRVPDPYLIGRAHSALARVASTLEEQRQHVEAAREAWTQIKRPDLVEKLDEEFGAPSY